MSDAKPAAVIPLDQLLSRRDFCRSLCVGGAALVTLGGCGSDPLVVQTRKDLATGNSKDPEDLATAPQPDLAMETQPDFSTEGPVDLAHDPDLARSPDMANPNACPLQNVVSSGKKPAAFAMNTATLVAKANMFICRDRGGYFGLDGLCTHNQCLIGVVNGGAAGFSCGCHGSGFTLDGVNTQGPNGSPAGSVADLDHYALCIDAQGNVALGTLTRVASNKRYAL